MAQTKVAILSFKEKALVHDRGRNFDSIVSKLGINVGNIKIQVKLIDELCATNRGGRTFLERKSFETLKRSSF